MSLTPGIYFGLPERTYHADSALSRSDLVALNDTPFTYWEQSWMNPKRRSKEESDEMKYGTAFHCQMFEPERFEKQYFVFPTEQWDNGRIMITDVDHQAIVDSIKVLRKGKDSNLFLSGGMPEVTIVFDAFGMRFRTRHDYLTPVASVDFKTTFSIDEWSLKKSFSRWGYDIQMYLYKLARARFKEQFLAGEAEVFGAVDEEFFKKFLFSEINDFIFIFQRKSPPYPYEALFPEDDTEQSGADKMIYALDVYRHNSKKYGKNAWEVSDGKLKRFSMAYGLIRE